MNLVVSKGEEDYFNGLPDEVVLLILSKLSEAKCLFMCKLVSKRFASFISQLRLRSLSFFVPHIRVPPKYSDLITLRARLWIFLKTLVYKISPNLIPIHPCEIEVDAPSFTSINQFLSNFEQIRSVCLVFPFNYEAPFEFKWYAEFTDSKKLDFFVMLSFESIDDMKQEEDDEQTDHQHPEGDDNDFATGHLVHAILYQSVMRSYLDDHILKQQLENAEITDVKRRGKVRKKLESVMEWEDEFWAMGMPFYKKVWRVPKLRIGSSRRVMKRAKLVAVRPMHWEADEFEDGLLEAATAFEQEEAELGEAVRQMLMDETTNMTTGFYIG
ncbi:F-box protein AUF2-like [Actinidia eriantha]|uniref:F-box protein AUF2-like n=1 Tax=Actinidia eriantha TaxID=165200 RepID=UPI002583235E|nr:F-box protein AUF2-like [Actinidia eriantha]